MKQIVNLVFAAVCACGAQSALSQETTEAPVAASESAETYLNVAAIGQSSERHAAAEAQMAPTRRSVLEEMGLAGHGPFPSQGGPLD